ncbi:MAG: tyrosine-type recombinase/integrase [Kurthia sp.]|nr:tyrosine-type recombinase/integrase [Candidatus Kurthia equi]
MNELISTLEKNELQLLSQKKYTDLQNRMDENEKENKPLFDAFTDMDMLFWFIHQRKNISQTKENNARTKYEYERELKQFITNLLQFAPQIDLDIHRNVSDSLLRQIEARHLRRYQEWLTIESPHVLEHGTYSPATLARKTTIIKAFFTFLYTSGYSSFDAAKGLRAATVHADDRPNRDLGPNEVTEILDTLEKVDLRFYTIILTLVTTGLRNEELCQLTLGSIKRDFIQGDYYFEVTGKGNKRRDVPIKAHLLERLAFYREAYLLSELFKGERDEPLFCTRSGKAYKPTYLAQSMSKLFKKTDFPTLDQQSIHITAHTFRHAYAIISHLNKVDVYDIMRSLGHEKIDTTMIYLAKITARSTNAIHSWSSTTLGKHF